MYDIEFQEIFNFLMFIVFELRKNNKLCLRISVKNRLSIYKLYLQNVITITICVFNDFTALLVITKVWRILS